MVEPEEEEVMVTLVVLFFCEDMVTKAPVVLLVLVPVLVLWAALVLPFVCIVLVLVMLGVTVETVV